MNEPRTVPQASPGERRLAMLCLEDGDTQEEVADLLQVSTRTVQRWWRDWCDDGEAGLAQKPGRGRHPKLTERQARQVLGWVGRSPGDFGFGTERWTAPRLAEVIGRRLGVTMHPRSLSRWLRGRGVTPQVPARQAAERDEDLIAAWVRYRWPRIKKTPGT